MATVSWAKAIALVDLNAFFASIEQHDHPELRGRPIAITNGAAGSCIITCSYEARYYGIKTGMRLTEAKKRCHHLIVCPSRPHRYTMISTTIMQILEQEITPLIEVFSIDEAFLDITQAQDYLGSIPTIGKQIKDCIYDTTGLLCSIGISGDKTTAKYAAKQHKPNGLTLIPPESAQQQLCHVPVTELCGIAQGIGRYLAMHGVTECDHMKRIPMQTLSRRFGSVGRRIWLMAQGKDPAPLQLSNKAPKSMGHGKVLPPNIDTEQYILTYFTHMAEKVAARLRYHHMEAQSFFIGIKVQSRFFGQILKTPHPCANGKAILLLCKHCLATYWSGQIARQVQITATDPRPINQQPDLFHQPDLKQQQKDHVVDNINKKYGSFCIHPATLLERSSMNDVIAPAWRPSGVRQFILDSGLKD